jgi:hypothetical protein
MAQTGGFFLVTPISCCLAHRTCGYRHAMLKPTAIRRTLAASVLGGALLFGSVACSSNTKDDLKKVGSDLSTDASTGASKASTGVQSVGSELSSDVSSASSSLSSSSSANN